MKKLFSLVGYITLDGLEKAEKKVGEFEKKVRKAIRPIDRFGKQVSGIGKSMTKTLTAPLALAGGAVVKLGADFEKAMSNSLAIMGDDAAAMRGQMEKTARDIAKTSTISAKQAAEAYYYLASAGMNAAQSMEALPKVAMFAQAGLFDMALATDLLTDAQSALGLSSESTAESIENLTRVSDVLVKANTIANASVQQFAESLTNKAGAALRLLNKDIEEGAAVLAVFADQGKKGAEAGTALDIVLRDLQIASINNGKAFKKANIAVYDSQGKMRNLADIVSDLETRLGGMSDEEKRAELMALGFTAKSVAATAALLGTSEAIREYEKELRNANGTTKEVADKQLENLWAQVTIVKHGFIDVAIELSGTLVPLISKTVIPVLESFADKLGILSERFTTLPKGVKVTVIKLVSMLVVAGPLIVIIGKLSSAITIVTTTIKAAKLAMIAFNRTVLANPFGLAIVGIVAATAAIVTLRAKYKSLREEHKKWTIQTTDQAAIKKFTDGVAEVIEKVKENGDVIKTDMDLSAMYGKEISILTAKAKAMNYVINGNTTTRLRAIGVISQELLGIRDITGKLIKYVEVKEEEEEKTKKNTKATKADIAVREEWADKLRVQGKEGVELLKLQQTMEVERAYRAKENAATIAAINKFYNGEIVRAEKKITDAKKKATDDRKKIAEVARDEELRYLDELLIAAKLAKASELTILEMQIAAEKKVAEESLKTKEEQTEAKELIDKKYYEHLRKLREDDAEEQTNGYKLISVVEGFFNDEKVKLGIQMYEQLGQLTQLNTQNKIDGIDIERAKQIEHVKATIVDKDEQEKAIDNINKVADKKTSALKQKQAKRDKRAAIFAAAMSAIQLAMSGFKTEPFMPLGLIMGGIATALGIGMVAAIASKPIPAMADGGVVPQTRGGRQVLVGEGNDSEAILPMRKGAAEIASNIMDKIGSTFMPEASSNSRPAFSRSGAGRKGHRQTRQTQNHWHIGTLVADDSGIKELERRQLSHRVAEEQRKGM